MIILHLWSVLSQKNQLPLPIYFLPYLNMKIPLFSKKKNMQPTIRFGRYSDAYKAPAQYAFWDKSVFLFEQKEYINACIALFDYLYDPAENNVKYVHTADTLEFEMVQGSKKIIGKVSNEWFTAEIDVVKCHQLSLPFMRRLMEMNFDLQFCRFALHNDTIYLKYHTEITDAIPEKLYYALREMATQADKYDDLFIILFAHLAPSHHTHYIPITEQEKSIKYTYLQQWINQATDLVHRLDHHAQSIAISYILLNTALKIDYLLAPQGKITDKIEFINELYYSDTTTPILERNTRALRELLEIKNLSPDDLNKELYQVHATFGLASYAQATDVMSAILSINNDIAQSNDRRYPAITQYITECSVQYALFHLGMPPCLQQYLHFIIHCLNNDYFTALGFDNNYIETGTAKLNNKEIKQTLAALQKNAQANFPNFHINVSGLNYKSLLDFIHSLVQALATANYSL